MRGASHIRDIKLATYAIIIVLNRLDQIFTKNTHHELSFGVCD